VYPEGESEGSNIVSTHIFTGIAPSEISDVTVYPNPAVDYVKISLNNKPVVSMNVYNSLGSIVAQKNVKGQTEITLNTRSFASGAYTVRFVTENGDTFSRKFIVRK
jgi:hypothetical protein